MAVDQEKLKEYLCKWQDILRLRDWDIQYRVIDTPWRKSGDIKIDEDNKMAVVLINNNGVRKNLEEIVVHELLHLKLWGMDQMIEGYINMVFGNDEEDIKRDFAMTMFFKELESTVEDLTKGYLKAAESNEDLCFNKLERMIQEEIESNSK